MSFWSSVRQLIMESDVVLLILDARMPDISINRNVVQIVDDFHKKLVYVFNKIDLVSDEHLARLKRDYKGAFFVSGQKNIGINFLKSRLLIMGKRMEIERLKVGIVGYPNVGKSAIINALAKRARTTVAPYAGTTKGLQWVKVSQLKIIDSPGVIPFEDSEVRLGLIGAKNPEKLKDNRRLAVEIINKFLNENPKSLEEFYKIKLESKDPDEIMMQIGKRRGFLQKGGVIDERRTALTIVVDWQKGKLRI